MLNALSVTLALHNSKSLTNHFQLNREKICITVFLPLLKLKSTSVFWLQLKSEEQTAY